MGEAVMVRPAVAADAEAIEAIYTPTVLDSTISFEEVAPDVDEIVRRMNARNEASVRFHDAMDFVPVGIYTDVGLQARDVARCRLVAVESETATRFPEEPREWEADRL